LTKEKNGIIMQSEQEFFVRSNIENLLYINIGCYALEINYNTFGGLIK